MYKEQIVKIARERTLQIKEQFIEEVQRLLDSGGIDVENINLGLLFGVALENISDRFLGGGRNSKEYKNLKAF